MAKYKLQELTDMRNEGKRRVYPKIVTNRTLSRKEFIKRMQSYHRGISESTTEAVLLDVADMLVEMLSMGYNVNIEGIARALEVIETNGLITLSDYANINNLSRTAASLELKEITASRTSPIDSTGSGSHKVWVKRKE